LLKYTVCNVYKRDWNCYQFTYVQNIACCTGQQLPLQKKNSTVFVGICKPFAWMGLVFGLGIYFELIIHFRRRYDTNEVITVSTALFNRRCEEDYMDLFHLELVR
jgi:hypothetical protein